MRLPKARTADLLVQELNDEVLICDLKNDKFYCLNSTAKIVYNACNGATTFAEFESRTALPADLIFFTLDELNKQNLLAKNPEYASPFANLSRREAVKRVGLASLIALPIVSTLIAPVAANAASNCTANNTSCCCNTNCCGACVRTINTGTNNCCYGPGAYLSQGFTGTAGGYVTQTDCQNAANNACCNQSATINSFDPDTGSCNITCN